MSLTSDEALATNEELTIKIKVTTPSAVPSDLRRDATGCRVSGVTSGFTPGFQCVTTVDHYLPEYTVQMVHLNILDSVAF